MLAVDVPVQVVDPGETSMANCTWNTLLPSMRLKMLLHLPLPRCPVLTTRAQDRLHVFAEAFSDMSLVSLVTQNIFNCSTCLSRDRLRCPS